MTSSSRCWTKSCPEARLRLSNSASLFLVDGHNLLFALRKRFAEHLVEGHPGTTARDALVEALLDVFTAHGQSVRVYFDGKTPHREQRSAQVEVIYPGGEGDQCADNAILRDLARRRRDDTNPRITVVTRDIKLARRARKRGATVVDPEAFFEAWVAESCQAAGASCPE